MQRQLSLGTVALFALLHCPAAVAVTPGPGWNDSYSVGGQCYCDTTYDHEIGPVEVDTPQGIKTVRQICEAIGPGPGVGSNPQYNDVQCGNGPANNAIDETLCPGRVDMGAAGCDVIGPTWNLDIYFPSLETSGSTSGATLGGTNGGSTDDSATGTTTDSGTGDTTAGATGDGTTGDTTTGDTTSGTAEGTTGDETGNTTTNTSGNSTEESGSTSNDTTEELPLGSLQFEAENLVSADSRWTLTNSSTLQDTSNDPDANHSDGASNTSYLELLPDTYVTNADTADNTNQWNDPGFGPVLQYDIEVPAPGVYMIAVRGYASGEHDRRIHASVDGLWNTNAANITLCKVDQWSWSHICDGETRTVEFDSAGVHQLMFSAADDGFEFDQFALAAVTDETTAAAPQLGNAVSVGNGVAFGAAVTPGLSGLLGFLLALRLQMARRRTSTT